MRLIDNSKIKPEKVWVEEAALAVKAVEADTSTVKDHSKIWRSLKDPLGELSHDKCWYCEVKQIRSDDAVDHFRPKDHYWWLAFSIKNFRYSCTYCNSRRKNPETGKTAGKGNFFPLLDESKKAKKAGDEAMETPMLLDPCEMLDPGHLGFSDNGLPKARHNNADMTKRANKSIELYHLDHPDLVDKRLALGASLANKIQAVDAVFPRYGQGDSNVDKLLNTTVKDLREAMLENAELSTFARCIISGHREKEWVAALIETL